MPNGALLFLVIAAGETRTILILLQSIQKPCAFIDIAPSSLRICGLEQHSLAIRRAGALRSTASHVL